MSKTLEFEGITLHAYKSLIDNKIVIEVEGPEEEENILADGSPDIRIWLNEAVIYNKGEVGHDLEDPLPEGCPI